ncbi:TonB-dependent receptor [Hymenobacter busanensis]|uniref:TonB-dependent receptor n=1 Tax=Hymenobacter busanensis TaxID=2607656 RepID=A0A7L4ZT84_9BACT|nr:outer membrane beta-barrel protein [Hymenobacter busanensis]KAA9339686.1 TonB-dependent receptor [Hymenobacter busanensis]QHJ06559.1 TonB-dependent receptor [Hymenobacter busanensis]
MKTLFTPFRPLSAALFLTPALLATTSFSSEAQTRGTVSGSVAAAGAAVDFATVTLHRAADSTVVKTEFSDEKGVFRFEQAPAGRYLVSAAQVGFARAWSAGFDVAGGEVQVPVLRLAASAATQLKEVQVVGQKPQFERLADRTVVNVEGSTLAAGNTSLDVLRRSPGVTVDGNDNLALRGRQGLLVLIDGKRQPMSGTELADYLRALPADQLKSIELITNPPAKYDAQGGAGIIAINLKKDQKLGTNGSVNTSYGYGRYGKFTAGLSLNHRRQKLNLFGTYNFAERRNWNALTINREFYEYPDGVKTLVGRSFQDNNGVGHGRSHNWKLGLDYNLTERTTVGVVANGLALQTDSKGSNDSELYTAEGATTSRYQSDNIRDGNLPNVSANANFRHTFKDSLGLHELSADADYARYDSRRGQLLDTRFTFPTASADRLTVDQHNLLTIQSFKTDYTRPLSKTARLEAGGKISWVAADNDLDFRIPVTPGNVDVLKPDPLRSNRFRYDENIVAGYVNFNQTLPKWTLQAGLRGEQTNAVGKQDVVQPGKDPNFDRHYFQLFPSAAVKHTFSEQQETSLSLSRRIDRPSYGQLNPFRSYIDVTTYGEGRPELRPQTSYNVELTHTLAQKYSIGVSYAVTANPIVGTVQPAPEGGRVVVSTSQNLDSQYNYALTLTAPVELAKWWNVYNNAVFYYTRFVGDLAGTSLNAGRPAFNLSSNSTFVLGHDWKADLNASYDSKNRYAYFVSRPQGQVSVGVQKGLWHNKATLKLNATDVFFTNKNRSTVTFNNYVERFYQRYESRVVTLALSYRFGNDKVAPTKRRGGGAEDEKRRAGGN